MPSWMKLVLAGVLVFGAYRWYVSYSPPEIKGLEPSAVVPASDPDPPAGRVQPHGTWVTLPTLTAQPEGVSGGLQVPPRAGTAEGPPAEAPPAEGPAISVEPAREEEKVEGPSEMDKLRAKIQEYRAQYGPAKARVETLEREVTELSSRASRFIGGGNSGPAIEADAVRSRLSAARNELDRARSALTAIEEHARRDGVSFGQLY